MRFILRLLQGAGAIGMGLSLIGLAMVTIDRAVVLPRLNANTSPTLFGGILEVLAGIREAGVPFLLSATLFTVCEIALRLLPHKTARDAD